jgi:hypothetical protein
VCTILRAMGQDKLADEYERNDDPLNEHAGHRPLLRRRGAQDRAGMAARLGEPLYSMANLEEAEGQLFGYGIPTIMEDSQDALNSSWRMALDNGALSVGPQALIAKDEIAPADGNWTFSRAKFGGASRRRIAHAPQSIQFFDVPNNMEEIAC